MSQQRIASLAAAASVALLGVTVSKATAPRIEPGTEEWVIAEDIPPFSITLAATWGSDGTKAEHFFGVHPENGGATASYSDRKRRMLVSVSVQREVRTEYLDFLIEHPYREDTTGRFYEPDTSLITLFGQPVLFYCDTPPNCTDRTYPDYS